MGFERGALAPSSKPINTRTELDNSFIQQDNCNLDCNLDYMKYHAIKSMLCISDMHALH